MAYEPPASGKRNEAASERELMQQRACTPRAARNAFCVFAHRNARHRAKAGAYDGTEHHGRCLRPLASGKDEGVTSVEVAILACCFLCCSCQTVDQSPAD